MLTAMSEILKDAKSSKLRRPSMLRWKLSWDMSPDPKAAGRHSAGRHRLCASTGACR